jgi:5-hydroxyisourate hydrolase
MITISTHVLDTSIGKPAVGVAITLSLRQNNGSWRQLGSGVTDNDGRLRDLAGSGTVSAGFYKLTYECESYFRSRGVDTFFPQIEISFTVSDANQHYHVPLLLSPYSYSTYRGS